MAHNHQLNLSLWQELKLPTYPTFMQDSSTDVAIVGAGIAGLTTAYILLKNGFKVTILDKEQPGFGETSLTSAHLSNVLDEGFQELMRLHGEDGAQKALASHSDAIELIEKIITEEFIDCDFKRLDGYLYQSPDRHHDYLQKEYDASLKAGFRGLELIPAPGIFPQLGSAIRYSHQAQFNPQKYVLGLIAAIRSMGGLIYGNSRVVEFGDRPQPFVKTADDSTLEAKHIVVCTNVPINDRIRIHTKEASYRTYVVGIEVSRGSFPNILLWDTAEPYHYVRKVEHDFRSHETVLIGGGDHRVGVEEHPDKIFSQLRQWAEQKLHIKGPMTFHWSGQIIEPIDGLAYIGRNPGDENIYIACGDSGHGLTHGSIAAMIIRDLIQGNENEWATLYSPDRINFKATTEYLKENASTVYQYKDRLHIDKDLRQEFLPAGEGTLLERGGEKLAIYRDENYQLHVMNAVCPHLGGVVHWNEAEKTWDCPCHGSRFSCTGEVLNGPAIGPLTYAVLPPEKKRAPPEDQPRL